MRKFPKLKYPSDPETDGVLGGEVVVTEKLDGANFRWTVEDGDIIIGTRNHTYEVGDPNIPKAFDHAVEWVKEQVASWDWEPSGELSSTWTFFGEAMHKHSLVYSDVDYVNPSRGSPYFGEGYPNVVMFDMWEKDYGWATWDEIEAAAEAMDIPMTQVLARGDGQELKDSDKLTIPNESMFGGQPEGIVVRRVDGSVRAKKVSENFKEQNAIAFDDPSKAQSDAAEFVAAFVTKPRIEKTAHKLVDRGEYEHLEMPMMEDLPREVLKDTMEEVGWSELLNGPFEAEWDDEFKGEVRSKTSKKCARILKEEIQEF